MDEKQRLHIYSSFVKDHSNNIQDINDALAAGNIKEAHRIAHTLKGVAGLMDKEGLRQAAQTVEKALKGEQPFSPETQMPPLERELNAVLAELTAELAAEFASAPKQQYKPLETPQACRILTQLEPLLLAYDSESLEFTENLRGIPGAQALIEQMEDYEFELARQTLLAIKRDLGC